MALRGLTICAGVTLFVAGCSASSSGSGSGVRPSADAAGSANIDPSSGAGSGGAGSINTGNGDGSGGVVTPGDACVITSATATLIKEPVDIILVLDNSGSMADELQAVEDNINQNFATILQQSGVDYRVILISRHRRDVRAASE